MPSARMKCQTTRGSFRLVFSVCRTTLGDCCQHGQKSDEIRHMSDGIWRWSDDSWRLSDDSLQSREGIGLCLKTSEPSLTVGLVSRYRASRLVRAARSMRTGISALQ